jgi:hypothetical protein
MASRVATRNEAFFIEISSGGIGSGGHCTWTSGEEKGEHLRIP